MNEKRINDRRHWKAQTFNYDYYLPDDSPSCTYCLTDKQAEILRGIILPMGWATRWWSDSDADIDPDTVEAFRDDITRRLMMGCCGDETPVRYRYNGTVLQKSTDGGLTWEDAPDNDYRNNSVLWPTPQSLGLASSKCQAADSVVATFRDLINEQIADDMAAAAIVGVIVTILLTFLSAGSYALIAAQVAGIAAAIFGAGVATWRSAFTTGVWDDFRCIVYCHMTDDNSIDQAGIDGIIANIGTTFTGVVEPTLQGYVSAAGVIGIMNMMRSNIGDSGADCSGCSCPEPCSPEIWDLFPDFIAIGQTLTRGADYLQVDAWFASGTYYVILQTNNISNCCYVDHVEIISGGAGDSHGWTDCNNPVSEYVPQYSGLGFGDCINHLYLTFSEPTTVKVFVGECP